MLRALKRAETLHKIGTVAYELFVARGFDAVTVEEIADKAGVSRRTFFRYFATKEEVVFLRNAERVEELRRLLGVQVEGETGFGAVGRACLAMSSAFADDRQEMLAQYWIVSGTPALAGMELMLDRRFEEVMIEGIVARDGKSRAVKRRARLVAAAVMGVVRATLREWLESGATPDLVALAEEALATLEAGLDPGRSKR